MNLDMTLATNLRGCIASELSAEIEAYCVKPSPERWAELKGVIIDAESNLTIWAAVNEINPTFQREASKFPNAFLGMLRPQWRVIPSADDLKQAIAYATH
jgi:hypothetical protein